MATVAITINGRMFRLQCGEGEEHRLVAVADDLQQRLRRLQEDFGAIGDDRLLLMAALMATDELFDARQSLANALDRDAA